VTLREVKALLGGPVNLSGAASPSTCGTSIAGSATLEGKRLVLADLY